MYKYAAFISYSSRDRFFAARLQGRLRRYRIPKKFGDVDVTGSGQKRFKRRIAPIFRDVDELSSGDLNENLKRALDESSALIVVCSPNSARSKWVEAEIQHFIDSGRSNRIFAIIKNGQPNAPPHKTKRECIPKALRGLGRTNSALHVVAADSRERKDGPKAAFLRVVAGIAELPFANLLDQQNKRFRSKRRWLATMAFLVSAALLVLTENVVLPLYQKWIDTPMLEIVDQRIKRLEFEAYLRRLGVDETISAQINPESYGLPSSHTKQDLRLGPFDALVVFEGWRVVGSDEWQRYDTYIIDLERKIEKGSFSQRFHGFNMSWNGTTQKWLDETLEYEDDVRRQSSEFEKLPEGFLKQRAEAETEINEAMQTCSWRISDARAHEIRFVLAEHDTSKTSDTFLGFRHFCDPNLGLGAYIIIQRQVVPTNVVLENFRYAIPLLLIAMVFYVLLELVSAVWRVIRGQQIRVPAS